VTIDNFIEKFAFAIEADASSLGPETEYKQLPQWDSLNTLSIIAMADADYGVTLSGQAINDNRTIADLWTVVSGKVKA
jgi:acyl carrier protein